jgi:hypothetical protein
VPYLLNTFALNTTSVIPISKSSIAIIILSLEQQLLCKKKKKNTYQNEFDNKQMKYHLTKLTIAKAHTWQNIHIQNYTLIKEAKKKVNIWWKFKPNTLFLLWKKIDNKHIVLYLYGTKDLI